MTYRVVQIKPYCYDVFHLYVESRTEGISDIACP